MNKKNKKEWIATPFLVESKRAFVYLFVFVFLGFSFLNWLMRQYVNIYIVRLRCNNFAFPYENKEEKTHEMSCYIASNTAAQHNGYVHTHTL